MTYLRVTMKNAKPGAFMNLRTSFTTFEEASHAVQVDKHIEGSRLWVEQIARMRFQIKDAQPALLACSEIASIEVNAGEFLESEAA